LAHLVLNVPAYTANRELKGAVMFNLGFWILVALIYSIFAVWTAKLILEGIFAAMARASAAPRPVPVHAPRRQEFDRAA